MEKPGALKDKNVSVVKRQRCGFFPMLGWGMSFSFLCCPKLMVC